MEIERDTISKRLLPGIRKNNGETESLGNSWGPASKRTGYASMTGQVQPRRCN